MPMTTLRNRARDLLRRVSRGLREMVRGPGALLSLLAAVVGLATGLLAVALIDLIALVQRLAYGSAPPTWSVLVVPAVGGLLAGLLLWRLVPEARGSGISAVMEALSLRGGRMRGRVIIGKLAASSLALGTGNSGGREGPIVQIGAAAGSLLGRLADLPEDRVRSLIAAGAAGGIAASFNAPIGGMLFALEVIIGGFALRHLQTVIISAVVASVTARQLVGEGLIFVAPSYSLGAPWELALYAMLGLAAVAVGLGFIQAIRLAEQLGDRLNWPLPLRTAAGGLVVGLVAVVAPEVLGTGDDLPPLPGVVSEPILEMLRGGFAPGVLVLLLVAKLVATVASVGSRNATGSFGPLLFLGAALGGAFGHAVTAILPDAGINPGALALAGTAAVVAAASRAPLTGVILVFELTGSYDMVVPLMLATSVATVLADRVHPSTLYTEPLERRGISYRATEDIDVLQVVDVREVMTADPAAVPADMTVPELREWFRRTRHHGAPVVTLADDGGLRLVGIVTLSDVAALEDPGETGDLASMEARTRGLTAADICTTSPLTVVPEDPVYRAVQRMAALDVGRLPVVDPDDPERLVGLVRRGDVLTAYQRAMSRSLASQRHEAARRLRDLGGAQFIESVVVEEAPAAGRRIADVDWPEGTVLTSVQRGGDLIVPSGETVLRAGDEVVALSRHATAPALKRLLTGEEALS